MGGFERYVDEPASTPASARRRKANGQADGTAFEVEHVMASSIEAKPIEWLWSGRLAIGKLTLFGGNPGAGKSTIAADVAARISCGTPWPDGSGVPKSGTVFWLSAEDSADDTIVPRLTAAGASLDRVSIIGAVKLTHGKSRTFSIADDLDKLRPLVAHVGDARLLIFDPITSYMGGEIDSHRTTDVRAVLEPLARFADDTRLAVLAITHPPKAIHGKAMNGFTGSLAYVAAARVALIAIEEPETDRRLLLGVKNNLGDLTAGLGYCIMKVELPSFIGTSRIAWDGRPVTVTANEAVAAASRASTRDKLKDAVQWLEDALADGPVPVKHLIDRAANEDVAEKTLRRASKKLDVVTEKVAMKGGWQWRLPGRGATP